MTRKGKGRKTCPHCGRKSADGSACYYEGPMGYVDWHDWAEHMGKTMDQLPCPGCGKYTMWVPR